MNNIINLLQKYYKLSGEQNESTKDLHFFIQKHHKILALLLLFPVFSSHTTRCKLPKKCEKTPFLHTASIILQKKLVRVEKMDYFCASKEKGFS